MLRALVRLAAVKLAVLAGLAALFVVAGRRFGRGVEADRRRLLAAPRPAHPPL